MHSLKLTAFFSDWLETVKKNATESSSVSSATTIVWCNMLIGNLTSIAPGRPVGTGDNSSDPPVLDAEDFADVVASVPRDGANADNASEGAVQNQDAQAEADSDPEIPPNGQEDAATTPASFSVTRVATQADDSAPRQQMRSQFIVRPNRRARRRRVRVEFYWWSSNYDRGRHSGRMQYPTLSLRGRTNVRFSWPNEAGQAGPANGSTHEGRGTRPMNVAGGQLAVLMRSAAGSANAARPARATNTSPAPEAGETGQIASDGPLAGALRQAPALQATQGLNRMNANQSASALPALAESLAADSEQSLRLFSLARGGPLSDPDPSGDHQPRYRYSTGCAKTGSARNRAGGRFANQRRFVAAA